MTTLHLYNLSSILDRAHILEVRYRAILAAYHDLISFGVYPDFKWDY